MSIDSARASARGMGTDKRARKKVVINNALTPHDPYIHRSSGTGGVWAIDAVNVVSAQAFEIERRIKSKRRPRYEQYFTT